MVCENDSLILCSIDMAPLVRARLLRDMAAAERRLCSACDEALQVCFVIDFAGFVLAHVLILFSWRLCVARLPRHVMQQSKAIKRKKEEKKTENLLYNFASILFAIARLERGRRDRHHTDVIGRSLRMRATLRRVAHVVVGQQQHGAHRRKQLANRVERRRRHVRREARHVDRLDEPRRHVTSPVAATCHCLGHRLQQHRSPQRLRQLADATPQRRTAADDAEQCDEEAWRREREDAVRATVAQRCHTTRTQSDTWRRQFYSTRILDNNGVVRGRCLIPVVDGASDGVMCSGSGGAAAASSASSSGVESAMNVVASMLSPITSALSSANADVARVLSTSGGGGIGTASSLCVTS
jgi:hypothetical protein